MSQSSLDSTAFPLVRITLHDGLGVEGTDALVAELEKVIARGPFAVVVDLSDTVNIDAQLRLLLAQRFDGLALRHPGMCVGECVFTKSETLRNAFNAYKWLCTAPHPRECFMTERAAVAWARDLLRERGCLP